jgi:hypothetical protein
VLVLARLLAAFRIAPEPGHVPRPVAQLTVRAEAGIRLRLSLR